MCAHARARARGWQVARSQSGSTAGRCDPRWDLGVRLLRLCRTAGGYSAPLSWGAMDPGSEPWSLLVKLHQALTLPRSPSVLLVCWRWRYEMALVVGGPFLVCGLGPSAQAGCRSPASGRPRRLDRVASSKTLRTGSSQSTMSSLSLPAHLDEQLVIAGPHRRGVGRGSARAATPAGS